MCSLSQTLLKKSDFLSESISLSVVLADTQSAATKSKTSEDIAQTSKYSPAYSPDPYYHSETEYWTFQGSPKGNFLHSRTQPHPTPGSVRYSQDPQQHTGGSGQWKQLGRSMTHANNCKGRFGSSNERLSLPWRGEKSCIQWNSLFSTGLKGILLLQLVLFSFWLLSSRDPVPKVFLSLQKPTSSLCPRSNLPLFRFVTIVFNTIPSYIRVPISL